MMWKQARTLTIGVLIAALGAALPVAHAVASETTEPLELADCAGLRVDFVSIMPEMIRPKKLVISGAPFDQAALARMSKAAEQDPNGLCHYRDANNRLPKATKKRVIFFGDSITEYWAFAAPDMFSGEVLNRGVSAQTTTQMLVRFRHDVIDLKPRVVHILAGVNDPMSPGGTLATRSNLMAMVELAQAHGIKVALGSLTPSTGFWLAPGVKLAPEIAALNAWLKDYAVREGITYIDYYAPMVGAEGTMRSDLSNNGLHPNQLGYDVLTPLARKALKLS